MIIAHNHPSEDLSPSDEDIFTTIKIIEAGKILSISVIDHLIITENEYVSFRTDNLI